MKQNRALAQNGDSAKAVFVCRIANLQLKLEAIEGQMPKLYACIISPDMKRDKGSLLSIARQFSYSIEMLDDGILFDVSGLERLVGKSERIAKNILTELKQANVPVS